MRTRLVLHLEGFDGPLDLLLELARRRRWIWRKSPSWRWSSNTSR